MLVSQVLDNIITMRHTSTVWLQVNYQHISFQSASEWVPAMDRVTLLVEESNISASALTQDTEDTGLDPVFPMAMRSPSQLKIA